MGNGAKEATMTILEAMGEAARRARRDEREDAEAREAIARLVADAEIGPALRARMGEAMAEAERRP